LKNGGILRVDMTSGERIEFSKKYDLAQAKSLRQSDFDKFLGGIFIIFRGVRWLAFVYLFWALFQANDIG
jgi:hypothetical protein